ncbi:MAG: hypothetical protein PWR07_2298 [Bacillota bacterium]|nr:hypothetical protein [Bacillota bacterium]
MWQRSISGSHGFAAACQQLPDVGWQRAGAHLGVQPHTRSLGQQTQGPGVSR